MRLSRVGLEGRIIVKIREKAGSLPRLFYLDANSATPSLDLPQPSYLRMMTCGGIHKSLEGPVSEGSAWRSASIAEDFADHEYPDFAQEFLRRNLDYRRDYQRISRLVAKGRMTTSSISDAVSKWGLVFRL